MAWILTLVANFTCSWFTIDLMLDSFDYMLGFGMWGYQGWEYVAATDGDGTGTIYYHQTCYTYGGYAINPDAKWKTAQAFSIIAGKS